MTGGSSIGVLALTPLLAAAALASGTFHQNASTHLTATAGGRSTGMTFAMRATDPAAPGGKPRPVRTIMIWLPSGTRVDLATPLARRCTVTDKQLVTPFGRACPRRSRIGTGSAVANIAPLSAPSPSATTAPTTVAESVDVYVRDARHAVLLVRPHTKPDVGFPPTLMHMSVLGTRLTIDVPRTVWGKLVHVVLVSLKLKLPALGSGANSLIAAGPCTAGRFAYTQRFDYATDDPPVVMTNTTACR